MKNRQLWGSNHEPHKVGHDLDIHTNLARAAITSVCKGDLQKQSIRPSARPSAFLPPRNVDNEPALGSDGST